MDSPDPLISTAHMLAPPVCQLRTRTTVAPRIVCFLDGDWSDVTPRLLLINSKRSPAKSGLPGLLDNNTDLAFPITLLVSANPAWVTLVVPSSAPTAAVLTMSSVSCLSDPVPALANPVSSPRSLNTGND